MLKFNWKNLLLSILLSMLFFMFLVKDIGWENYFFSIFIQAAISSIIIALQENL